MKMSSHKKRFHSKESVKTADRRISEKRRREESSSEDHFSFENYSGELNRAVINDEKLKINTSDFWMFVRKYEAVQKKKQGSGLALKEKNEVFCTDFNMTVKELDNKIPSVEREILSKDQLDEFLFIIKLYLDFRQKEKFIKIRKIRKTQQELPVAAYEEQIIESVKNERVIIIAGDTGCGKSTQVPQYLLKCGYNHIACTQPRRIACISLSKRLSYETLNEFTNTVGYQIRFEKEKNISTKIVFITEGLLLRQVSMDSSLSNYDIVVLDEVHERHLYGDFLLGILKCLLHKNKEFKLVLMSATINLNLFASYFGGNAKVIQVPGRLHPVELIYRPMSVKEEMKVQLKSKKVTVDPTPYLQIIQTIDHKYLATEKGDVLIFLSGMAEISKLVEAIKEYNLEHQRWIVLPLHSSLSLSEQDKVFDYPPDGVRKCIVSTNIAETSVTIDGIRFVIDSGKVKEMFYDPIQKVHKLKEFWISAASAEQRKGRAGRTGPGVCYRVYSQEDYDSFQPYSTPEIQRVSLDSLLLQMISMGLPNCRKFPFLEAPDSENIENALMGLKLQGALSRIEKITPMGRMLSTLPIDIVLGKMLILGTILQQNGNIIPLVASLSVQSPFTHRAYRDTECERSWKEFESDQGDPITLLKLYSEWLYIKSQKENSRRWCSKKGLEEQRFYEITKLCTQFKQLLSDSGLLNTYNKTPLTKAQRSLRHGEVKLLKSAKKGYIDEKKSRGRKTLKLESWHLSEEQEEFDIKDVEFRLSNDRSKLDEWLKGLNISSHQNILLTKIIFCCGLYPQFAMRDDLNDVKTTSDQLFHTKHKPYIFLHPNSYFGTHPDALKLNESEIIIPKNSMKYEKKSQFSSKHQILCYVSMLETNKTYLTNSIRMPALQTFLMCSTQIETNFDFSRIICDEFVMFDILNPLQSEILLVKLVQLRKTLTLMLDTKINQCSVNMESMMETLSAKTISNFLQEIILFHTTEVAYSMKRLLQADLKTLYIGPGSSECLEFNPLDEDYKMEPNFEKGGVKLTEYLTYNCVITLDGHNTYDTMVYECENCKTDYNFNCLERLQHRKTCKGAMTEKTIQSNTSSNSYFCKICQKNFSFTSVQILKHMKQHAAVKNL